ncbi:MAG: ABC transporter substrate-binding protein [Bacteroidia bacterium]
MILQKGWKWLGVVGLLSQCRSGGDPPPGVLRVALFSPYSSLDPIYARDLVSVWLTQQLFRGLVTYDTALRIVPDAAARWEVSPDGRRYRFVLRRNLSYTGHPHRYLKAQDVVYSWHRLAQPQWASPGRYLFRGIIAGWEAYEKQTAPTIRGLRVLNDSVLEVELERPYSLFLHLLTLPYAAVVLPEAVERLGRRFAQQPVGLGPFRLLYEVPGRLVVLKREMPKAGRVEKLVFRWYPNRLQAWLALQRGEIDAIEGVDIGLRYLLRRDTSWKRWAYLVEVPQLGIEYLGLDTRPSSPLGKVELRRTLRALVRRCRVAETLWPDIVQPAHTFIPPVLLAWTPSVEADLPDSALVARLRQLSLTLYAAPAFRELCEYLQACLKQQGVPLRIEYLLGPSLREFLNKGRIALWKASWLADFPEGENFLLLFESSQQAPKGPNTFRLASEELDTYIQASRQEPNPFCRKILYSLAEELLQRQAPAIPLYHGRAIWVLHRRVRAFPQSALAVWLPLHEVICK